MAGLWSDWGILTAGLEHERGTETERAGAGVLHGHLPPDDVLFRNAPCFSFFLNLPFSAPAFHFLFCSLTGYLCVILFFLLLLRFLPQSLASSVFSYFMESTALADVLGTWGWSLKNYFQRQKMQFALESYQICSINRRSAGLLVGIIMILLLI